MRLFKDADELSIVCNRLYNVPVVRELHLMNRISSYYFCSIGFISEFHISTFTFKDPSACFSQIVTYFP